MLVSDILGRYQRKEPLPLMAWALVNHALSDAFLNDFFERNAARQYSKKLLFSNIFALMNLVVTRVKSSVGEALRSKLVPVDVSDQAFYAKLNSIEPEVCEALVREASQRLAAVSSAIGNEKPAPLPGYRTIVIDGNAIGASQHRIDELQDIPSAPMPGKSIVFLDPQHTSATEMIACEDGWAQERSMSNEIIKRICIGDLAIADRNFCTRKLLFGIHDQGGSFIIREHKSLPWEAIGSLEFVGENEGGRFFEQQISIKQEDGSSLVMRRIVIELPEQKSTRDGDRTIALLTILPPLDADAMKVGDLYLTRWTIETLFQTMTTTFRCEMKSLGYPRAALFIFAMTLVASNVLSTLRATIRSVHGYAAEAVLSSFYLVRAIQSSYETFIDGFGAEVLAAYNRMSLSDVILFLRNCAQHLDLSRYKKARTQKGRERKTKKGLAPQDKPHVSTARILAASKRKKNFDKISFSLS